MAIFTDSERAVIESSIAANEKATTGEIVVAVARSSDSYRFIPTLWAACGALLVPAFYVVPSFAVSASTIYLSQILVFMALQVVFFAPSVRVWLVPRSTLVRRASRFAYLQFHHLRLHTTKDRAGVMIFVSLAERYIEILADNGISTKVDPKVWNEIVDTVSAFAKDDRLHVGLVVAVDKVGGQLLKHFPGKPDNANELPDRIVEIE